MHDYQSLIVISSIHVDAAASPGASVRLLPAPVDGNVTGSFDFQLRPSTGAVVEI
ncbi:MAG: hypothetical protein KDI74_04070 [Gammaproteobacteria bacterium]|nr:hypothetical protein [Gammaproteobacteria bacterium]HXK55367.1 hypothetical protein [Gammaproteobacteria bacterium]